MGAFDNLPPGGKFVNTSLAEAREGLYTWDPLHKTGLVDKAVTGQDSFKWLQDMISCC